MAPTIWKRINYKMHQGKWGFAIVLEAGFTSYQASKYKDTAIQLTDGLYYQDICPPYPNSENLSIDEADSFCLGLKIVSNKIIALSPFEKNTLIILRYITFSYGDIQNEGFTAAAMQWAGETFEFPVTGIKVIFDPSKGKHGRYVYQFNKY